MSDGSAEHSTRLLFARLLPPLLLAVLPFLVFLPLTLVRETWYKHDVQHYFYAYHALSTALVRSGQWPLWNPYAFSGIPLLGDGQTAMFYPPNWLFFLFPGAAGLNYAIMLQFSIAGVGMYGCARWFGLLRVPALLAAMSFMFCGLLTARVVHLSIMSGAALVPLVVWWVDRALWQRMAGEKKSLQHPTPRPWRWFGLAAVAAALQAVAGHPQIPVYTAVALGVLALVRAAEAWVESGRWRVLVLLPLRLAGIYMLGYALAAIQLVPWIELGTASPRAAGASFEFVMGSGSNGIDWLLFLFPFVNGAQQVGWFASEPMGISLAVRTWEHSAYVGVPILALAFVGVGCFVARSARVWRGRLARQPEELHHWFTLGFLIIVLILGALTAAGKYTPFAEIVYATPVVGRLRAVERALILVAFALPLLAGWGLQSLTDLRRNLWQRLNALAAAALVLAAPLLVVWYASQRSVAFTGMAPASLELVSLDRANGLLPVLLALATAALLGVWAFRPAGRLTLALVTLLVAVDMSTYGASFNPTADAQIYANGPESLQALNGSGEPFRKATVLLTTNEWPTQIAQETLAVSWAMVYGVEDINGFNSLQPRRYTDYLFGPQVSDVSYGYLNNQALFQPNSPILSSLNVRYLLVPRAGPQPTLGAHFEPVFENAEVRVYENTLVWPRAFFPALVRTETDPAVVLQTVTAAGFDGRQQALVESNALPVLPEARGTATARVLAQSANEMTVATTTSEMRLLVVADMYFPGWRAFIDGQEATIERTNYLFRGVVVPAGEHTVRFAYEPRSAVIGAAISALACLLIVALVAMPTLRRTR